jgi:proteasome lid subunit RPN8/RPN11
MNVSISQELLLAIFEGAKRLYPRETILLLRGQRKKDLIVISDLVIPPLAAHGKGFATVAIHMLPMDFSLVGTVHSHPSGNLAPSSVDLNRSFGKIIMIVAYPFVTEQNVAVYDRTGQKIKLQITVE